MNAQRFSIYVSINAIAPGRRARTRDAIGMVRHIFLDADQDGPAVLGRIAARQDLPEPSYMVHSSPNRVHVFWRVAGFEPVQAEALQKTLARELGTDLAATPSTQLTRLPGFFNHKYASPHLVTIDYRQPDRILTPEAFPPMAQHDLPSPTEPPPNVSCPCPRWPCPNERAATWLGCRPPLRANTAISTRFRSAAASSVALHWGRMSHYRAP